MEKLKRMASAIEAYGMADPAIGDECQCYRVQDVDPLLEEIRNLKPGMKEWEQLIHTVRRCWEYGIHANDLTLGEIEEDISFALSRFAEANGLPVPDWDAEYVEEDADD